MVSPLQALSPSPPPAPKPNEFVPPSDTWSFAQSLNKAVKDEGGGKPKAEDTEPPDDEERDDGKPKPKPPSDSGEMAALLLPNLKREIPAEGTQSKSECDTVDSQVGTAKPTSGAEHTPKPSTNQSVQTPETQTALEGAKPDGISPQKSKGFALNNLFKTVKPETIALAQGKQGAPLPLLQGGEPSSIGSSTATFQAFPSSALERIGISLSLEKTVQPEVTPLKPVTATPTGATSIPVIAATEKASLGQEQSDKQEAKERRSEAVVSVGTHKTEITPTEKFVMPSSTANTVKEAAPSQPTRLNVVERMQLVEQVSRKLETMRLQNGNGEMNLRLRPDHLGEIQIRITSNVNGVTARIVADNAPVQQTLAEAKEHLQRALENRGLSLNGYEVSLQNSFSGGQPQRQQYEAAQTRFQTRGTRSRFQVERKEAAPTASVAATRTVVRDSLSRLDYSA